ncbi:GNAT family N-acetyltransferase [Brevibacillus formosus]|uniref:GNAT family N-acetyltransferase n=1 Tax=Brevibacillus formosus TaxID=54913 RepID=UPI003F1CFF91
MLSVQEAKDEHVLVMCSLLIQLYPVEKDFTHVNQIEKVKNGLNMIMNRPESGQLLVLLENNQVIGMANLLDTIHIAEGGMDFDFILSIAGRGKGYVSFFMKEIIRFAKENGFLRISLLVDSDHTTAQRFNEGVEYQHSNMRCMRLNLKEMDLYKIYFELAD